MKVHKKNVSRFIADLRSPNYAHGELVSNSNLEPEAPINTKELAHIFEKPSKLPSLRQELTKVTPRHFSWPRIILVGFGLILIMGVLGFFASYRSQKVLAKSGTDSLSNFQGALSRLDSVGLSLPGLTDLTAPPAATPEGLYAEKNSDLGYLLKSFWPVFRESGSALKDFQTLTGYFINLSQALSDLKNNWSTLVFKQQGGELLSKLENIQKVLAAINYQGSRLSGRSAQLSNLVPFDVQTYLPLQIELNKLEDFLGHFIVWLKAKEAHHILVLFHNPSELRPGGGFVGSYADLTLRGANLENIEVHDINDADRELNSKLIPPQPLQALVRTWRAADANWFLDYKLSSEKTMAMLEASDLYKKDGITFDGVIGVSAEAVGDLLALTGPIELKERKITLNNNNFLIEIQKSVQAGQAKGSADAKEIIKEFTPLLLEKLQTLEPDKQDQVFLLLGNWLAKKDVLAYFKNPDFQAFFDSYNWTGRVYALPSDFNGDYLAVVSANVGGGKSDLVMDQAVNLISQLETDGTVTNHLTVTRTHQGSAQGYSWYDATNEAYMQIFTPPATRLTSFEGGFKKDVKTPLDYKAKGYSADSLVSEIEASLKDYVGLPLVKSFEESGKNVFGAWSRVKPGTKINLVYDYERKLFAPPKPGAVYQFVFEKQPGSQSAYHFQINAPTGFRWQETGLPIFEYDTKDPPGRLLINLTLAEI